MSIFDLDKTHIKENEEKINVEIKLPVGFKKRLLAKTIDYALMCLFYLVYLGILKLIGINGGSSAMGFASLLFMIILFFYFVILPISWNGQTYGKKLLKIRIVSIDEHKIKFGTMIRRIFFSSFVYNLSLGIGYIISAIMMGTRKDKRSWHDFIAGTYVRYDDDNILTNINNQLP